MADKKEKEVRIVKRDQDGIIPPPAENKKDDQKNKTFVPDKAPEKAPKKYNLLKAIKKCDLYRVRNDRNIKARNILESVCPKSNKQQIFPGQLVMFQYFNPKTKEELEYYDAMPVTIFFGLFKSKEGLRYVGFNIHYYPPQLRYQIMNKIFEIYKPVYMKYWNDVTTEIDAFDYQYLIENLKKAKMDFGIRMYIPTLCGIPRIIAPRWWHYAVFTEGKFEKQTRAAIMKYWNAKNPKVEP